MRPEAVRVERTQLYDGSSRFSTDLVVIAAPSAEKWRANLNAEADLRTCLNLAKAVATSFKAKRVLHLSTIDVYPRPIAVDENEEPPVNLGYGGNRLRLSRYLRELGMQVSEVRLPGLFGQGLKKNLAFDLKHGRVDQLVKYNPSSTFQYVQIEKALSLAIDATRTGIEVLNVCSEPLAAEEILPSVKWSSFLNEAVGQVHYDVRTTTSSSGYQFSAKESQDDLAIWASRHA